MESLGARSVRVVRCGGDYLDPPTTVVVADRKDGAPRSGRGHRATGAGAEREEAVT